MPQFAVGDIVRVTNDTEGALRGLRDKVGRVMAIGGILWRGTRGNRHGEQQYYVDFDGIGIKQDIWESWLIPQSN